MKNLLFILTLTFAGIISAQETTTGEVKIQTSAECGSCKTRLEDVLNYTKGVKFAELNLEDKKVTVGVIDPLAMEILRNNFPRKLTA